MLKKLSDRVYYMPHDEKTDRPVLGLVCGDKYSLIVDAGNSPNHATEFLLRVSELKVPPVKYLVLTHWHWDHIFGIETMKLITVCHEKTNEKLKKMKLLNWEDEALDERVKNGEEIEFCSEMIKLEMPIRGELKIGEAEITFNNKLEIDLGGISVIVENIKGDHSEDSSIIYIPSEEIMFLGDSISEDIYSGEWSYSQEKLLGMIGRIRKYNVKCYLASHREPYNKMEMNKVFDDLIEASDFVDDITSFEKVLKMHHTYYGRHPNENEAYTLKSFVNGNKKRQIQNI